MQDATDRLCVFMNREGLTQEQLAKAAGVSQATVWRALNRRARRRGAARFRLFTYANIDEWIDASRTSSPRERVIAAVERVWDHSEAHADAIIRVIDALADLRPLPKDDDGR